MPFGVHCKKSISDSMRHILILLFALITLISSGQDNETDFISEIKQSDISDLWTIKILEIRNDTFIIERPEPLGCIGDNYQRFYIHFISVIKNPNNGLEYYVYGKSKVKTNICSFQGLITITESKIYVDSDFPNVKLGLLKGNYEFFEDSDQKGTGVFKGTFQTDFYINTKGEIKYNNKSSSDDFHNNQFKGTWTGYKSADSKRCSWGDFRILDSGKLDCGVSEFCPRDEYLKYDWLRYKIAFGGSSDRAKMDDAKKSEKEEWWKDK
jgi:hypothetical protein